MHGALSAGAPVCMFSYGGWVTPVLPLRRIPSLRVVTRAALFFVTRNCPNCRARASGPLQPGQFLRNDRRLLPRRTSHQASRPGIVVQFCLSSRRPRLKPFPWTPGSANPLAAVRGYVPPSSPGYAQVPGVTFLFCFLFARRLSQLGGWFRESG